MPAFANSPTADTLATCMLYGDITCVNGFWHGNLRAVTQPALQLQAVNAQKFPVCILRGQGVGGCMYAVGNDTVVACAVDILTKQM